MNDTKKPKRPKVYELATRETVARWMWLPPGMAFFYALRSTLPLEEYKQKMQTVLQLIEAKTHLPRLLDEVERGETLIITRHGRRIARIVPEVDRRQEEVDSAIGRITALRSRATRISLAELLSARDEGRRG